MGKFLGREGGGFLKYGFSPWFFSRESGGIDYNAIISVDDDNDYCSSKNEFIPGEEVDIRHYCFPEFCGEKNMVGIILKK